MSCFYIIARKAAEDLIDKFDEYDDEIDRITAASNKLLQKYPEFMSDTNRTIIQSLSCLTISDANLKFLSESKDSGVIFIGKIINIDGSDVLFMEKYFSEIKNILNEENSGIVTNEWDMDIENLLSFDQFYNSIGQMKVAITIPNVNKST